MRYTGTGGEKKKLAPGKCKTAAGGGLEAYTVCTGIVAMATFCTWKCFTTRC